MTDIERATTHIGRRLAYAQACGAEEVAVNWESLHDGLRECATWPALDRWLAIAERNLKENAKHRVWWPVLKYSTEVVRRQSATARLVVRAGDLVPAKFAGLEVRRIPDPTIGFTIEWGHEALLAWYPWVPRLDPAIFDVVFENAVQKDTAGLKACIESLIPEGPGRAVLLASPGDEAFIIESATVRESWEELLWGIEDLLIIPVAPKVADWAVSWFHNDRVELGKRRSEWLHSFSWID